MLSKTPKVDIDLRNEVNQNFLDRSDSGQHDSGCF